MKTYILYDTYETGVDLGEEIGCYNSYAKSGKTADRGHGRRMQSAICCPWRVIRKENYYEMD